METEKKYGIWELSSLAVTNTIAEARWAAAEKRIDLSEFPFAELAIKREMSGDRQLLSQEEMEVECTRIKEFIEKGTDGNFLIRLDTMMQICNRKKYPLNEVLIKVHILEEKRPRFLFLKSSETLQVLVFIGGESKSCFLVIKEDEDKLHYLQVQEFYMLSIVKDCDAKHCWGLATSYNIFTEAVYSEFIQGINFKPIIMMFTSDWFKQKGYEKKEEERLQENEK